MRAFSKLGKFISKIFLDFFVNVFIFNKYLVYSIVIIEKFKFRTVYFFILLKEVAIFLSLKPGGK